MITSQDFTENPPGGAAVSPVDAAAGRHPSPGTPPSLLEVRGLYKYFPVRQTLLDGLLRRPPETVKAVDGVSFNLGRGEVLALVGESGSGKTTIARTLIGLEEPTAGQIFFDERRVEAGRQGGLAQFGGRQTTLGTGAPVRPGAQANTEAGAANAGGEGYPGMSLHRLRQQAQMIFQDPYESLNPRATIFDIVAEPLQVHRLARQPGERRERVAAALEDAGLRPAEDYFQRYPHELSGGQRQRVVIAAAMVLHPQLLLADEPVSMLDVSIRAEILNLLRDLRREHGVSILFITHDLSTVAYFADRVAVMYLGRIVESGSTGEVLRQPRHPYTQALLSVAPVANPRLRRKRIILQGETPNPLHIPPGCRFHPRCPLSFDLCREVDPAMEEILDPEGFQKPFGSGVHLAACHLFDQK